MLLLIKKAIGGLINKSFKDFELINIDDNTLVIHYDRTVAFLKTNSFQKSLIVFGFLYNNKLWSYKTSSYDKRSIISDCYFRITNYHVYLNKNVAALFLNPIK